MALTVRKNTTFNGESVIDGVQAASMNASIDETGKTITNNRYVINQEVYEANKAQVRNDYSEFDNLIYEEEDAIAALLAEKE